MIAIENANDFEFYSANSAGGIQGYGYQCRNAGYVHEQVSCDEYSSLYLIAPDLFASSHPQTGQFMTSSSLTVSAVSHKIC